MGLGGKYFEDQIRNRSRIVSVVLLKLCLKINGLKLVAPSTGVRDTVFVDFKCQPKVQPVDPENDKVHWLDGGRAVVVKNYESAKVAGRSSNTTFVRGDGKKDEPFGEGVLEVILYLAP